MTPARERGQSLIELVIAVAVAITFMTAAVGAITFSLRIDTQNKFSQSGGELAHEILEQVATLANDDWHSVDLLTVGAPYSIATSTGFFSTTEGSSTIALNGILYETSFTVHAVHRTGDDTIVAAPEGTLDPSTVRIAASVAWTQASTPQSIQTERYLTRIRNRSLSQTDWSSGSSTAPSLPATSFGAYFRNATNTAWQTAGQLTIADPTKNLFATPSNGIDPLYRYAWNDVIGWIDFLATNTVTVGTTVTGYASSGVGYISLDCATAPAGSVCGQSNYAVRYDSATTRLSGYAWSDSIGWISFNCSDQNSCASTTPCPSTNPNCQLGGTGVGGIDYYAWIDGSGYFNGFAWNDAIGWISFNCANTSSCGAVQYKVRSGSSALGMAELESITFDTQRSLGAAVNTILWRGTQALGTSVNFQIATSDCANGATNPPSCSTGTWSFSGPDGTANTYYQPIAADIQARIQRSYHNNDQYLRYKVFLYSDPAQSSSPTINGIILNWSH